MSLFSLFFARRKLQMAQARAVIQARAALFDVERAAAKCHLLDPHSSEWTVLQARMDGERRHIYGLLILWPDHVELVAIASKARALSPYTSFQNVFKTPIHDEPASAEPGHLGL